MSEAKSGPLQRDPHEAPLDEAIARVLWAQNPLDDHVAARAILDMPQMQAIRSALALLNKWGGPGYLDYLDLPRSVIEWAVIPTGEWS